MGSVFKPTRVDPKTGKRVRYKRYRIVWTDAHGQRQSEMAYSDHAASKALLDRREREAARRREGLPVADHDRLRMPAGEVVQEFLRELVSRGSEPDGRHVEQQRWILTTAFDRCGWETLGDVGKDGLHAWLASMAEDGLAASTRRQRAAYVCGMVRWAQERGWLAADPLAGLKLPRAGPATRKRRRRALQRDELMELCGTAPASRARLYRLAALSGFRRNELRLMERRDCAPDGDRPVWKLRPTVAKNRRCDAVPVCPDALDLVRPLWATLELPTSRLIGSPLMPRAMPSGATFRRDLARAGIERVDGEGRVVDFHSLRYTFCWLMAEVLPIQAVKVLMRHSTIKMTCDVYQQLGLEEVGARVWNLPRVFTGDHDARSAADSGQGGFGG